MGGTAVDPTTAVASKVAVPLVRAVWGGAIKAKDGVEAHRTIGAVVHEALLNTLCPSQPDDPAVRIAVIALENGLQSAEMPAPQTAPRGRLGRMGERARRKVPGRRVPAVPAFQKRDFYGQLSEWLRQALDDRDTRHTVAQVECGQANTAPEALVERFPAAFFEALNEHPEESKWRESLLRRLRRADEDAAWQLERMTWAERVLTGVGAAGTGAVTEVVVNSSGGSDGESLAAGGIAAAGALLTGVVAGKLDRRRAREASPTARRRVAEWLGDFALSANGKHVDAHSSARALVGELLADPHPLPAPSQPSEAHLAKLQARAERCGDDELAEALFEFDVALARRCHTTAAEAAEAQVRDALRNVAELVDPIGADGG